MTISQRSSIVFLQPSSRKHLSRLRSVLLAGIVSLAFGITACSPTNTAADVGNQTDEQTATREAATSVPQSVPKIYTKDGVALEGADPVAYFTEEAFVPGSADYTYEWQGVSWQFASAENRSLFTSNPEQYAPQYGGHCAWAIAAKNTLVPIDPEAWRVVDGKLYLNANKKVQKNWEKDIPGFIAQADSKWPALSVQ